MKEKNITIDEAFELLEKDRETIVKGLAQNKDFNYLYTSAQILERKIEKDLFKIEQIQNDIDKTDAVIAAYYEALERKTDGFINQFKLKK